MTPLLRACVVTMIEAGSTNCQIRDRLGVTLNQVAGVRRRDFGATMTQAEARVLGQNAKLSRTCQASILKILGQGPSDTMRIAAAMGISRATAFNALRRLVRRGAAERLSIGRSSEPAQWSIRASPVEHQPMTAPRFVNLPAAWVSPERDAALVRHFPTMERTALLAMLAGLPGPALPSWEAIGRHARNCLHLRRSTSVTHDGPIPIDLEGLRIRGAMWGIRVDSSADLYFVNQAAAAKGHPGFVLQNIIRS